MLDSSHVVPIRNNFPLHSALDDTELWQVSTFVECD
jgi:hypothetical protein